MVQPRVHRSDGLLAGVDGRALAQRCSGGLPLGRRHPVRLGQGLRFLRTLRVSKFDKQTAFAHLGLATYSILHR